MDSRTGAMKQGAGRVALRDLTVASPCERFIQLARSVDSGVGDSQADHPSPREPRTAPPLEVRTEGTPRHFLFVRVTHWLHTLSFLSLILSGAAILLGYPRFHWGETGTVGTPAFINLPFPFVLELGIRGPGRYLHFLAAWITLFTGFAYVAMAVRSRHLSRNLVPASSHFKWPAIKTLLIDHLRFRRPPEGEAWHYNLFQRLSYLTVVFVLLPFMFWTGLAMSPSVTSVLPILVNSLGGEQTARTLHFFDAVLLLLFFLVHVFMVIVAGFGRRCWAMITGYPPSRKKQP